MERESVVAYYNRYKNMLQICYAIVVQHYYIHRITLLDKVTKSGFVKIITITM